MSPIALLVLQQLVVKHTSECLTPTQLTWVEKHIEEGCEGLPQFLASARLKPIVELIWAEYMSFLSSGK
jgi:hypothetical protein